MCVQARDSVAQADHRKSKNNQLYHTLLLPHAEHPAEPMAALSPSSGVPRMISPLLLPASDSFRPKVAALAAKQIASSHTLGCVQSSKGRFKTLLSR